MTNFKVEVANDYLTEFRKCEMEGYITSHLLEVSISDKVSCKGVLNITFDVIGYGIEGFDGGIDVSYQVMFFVDPSNPDDYLDDAEAFVHIFSNYGGEINDIVNLAYSALDDFYANGIPLSEFANYFE